MHMLQKPITLISLQSITRHNHIALNLEKSVDFCCVKSIVQATRGRFWMNYI